MNLFRVSDIKTFGIRVFSLFGKVAGRPSGESRLNPAIGEV
jgi:hypothetical protein